MKYLLTGLGIGIVVLIGWLVLLNTERVEINPAQALLRRLALLMKSNYPKRAGC